MGEIASEPNDFVAVVSHLTNFVENERVRSYNEAVDMMLAQTRQWMLAHNIAPEREASLPELLDQIEYAAREAVEERISRATGAG